MITVEELLQGLVSLQNRSVLTNQRVDSVEASMKELKQSVDTMITTLKRIIDRDC